MFDCWKNNCHGATVVPTIAMISRTDVELTPPWIPGTAVCLTTGPLDGWLRTSRGITSRFAAMNRNMNRSQRRKLPLAVTTTSVGRRSEPRCTR